MVKRKKLTLSDKQRITEEIKAGYFGDGKYVVFVGDEQVPVLVIEDVAELPTGERLTIPLENRL